MTENYNQCNPHEFYDNEFLSRAFFDPKFIIFGLVIFIWVNSPVLIASPFLIPKLKTNCRKIIAMIVLSDLLGSICAAVAHFRKFGYESENKVVCFLVTQMDVITTLWSQIWSLLLILNVFLTLKPIRGLSGSSDKFLFFCHSFAWIYGIALALSTSGLGVVPIEYQENVITGKGCWGNFTLRLSEDESDCLLDGIGRRMWFAFYVIVSVFLLVAVVLFTKTVYTSYNAWKINSRTSARRRQTVNNEQEMDDGLEVATSHSRSVFLTTLRLSLTAFLYVFSFAPVLIVQVHKLYEGPISNRRYRERLNFWGEMLPYLIGCVNIVSYGYFSPVFRREIKKFLEGCPYGNVFGRKDTRQSRTSPDLELSRQSSKSEATS